MIFEAACEMAGAADEEAEEFGLAPARALIALVTAARLQAGTEDHFKMAISASEQVATWAQCKEEHDAAEKHAAQEKRRLERVAGDDDEEGDDEDEEGDDEGEGGEEF